MQKNTAKNAENLQKRSEKAKNVLTGRKLDDNTKKIGEIIKNVETLKNLIKIKSYLRRKLLK